MRVCACACARARSCACARRHPCVRIPVRQVVYLHSEGVCHQDIKPENVMLDEANTVKLIDFGTAQVHA